MMGFVLIPKNDNVYKPSEVNPALRLLHKYMHAPWSWLLTPSRFIGTVTLILALANICLGTIEPRTPL